MSSSRYHILPEDTGRPSIETNPDEESQSLIRADSMSETSSEKARKAGKSNSLAFKDFPFTLIFRFLAFVFFFASDICLGLIDESAVFGIICVTLALTRITYVIFSYLITAKTNFSLNLEVSGLGKRKGGCCPSWLKGRTMGLLIDLVLILFLFIALPMGLSVERPQWQHDERIAYAVGLSGMPWYMLSLLDRGNPSSVGVTFEMNFGKKEQRDDVEEPRTPRQEYRDIEAQQPDVIAINPEPHTVV